MIFYSGCKFAFETFVNLTSEMTPSPKFSYCTLCVLPRCPFRAIKRHEMFLLCRDTSVNVYAGNPHWSPQNEGFWGNNSPWDEMYRWDSPKAHPWPEPRRLMYNMWYSSARGRLCACPTKHRKKTPSVDNFTHMGSHEPAYHYKLWPTWWSHRRNQLYKFLLWSVKGFLFCEVLNMAISYT